MLKTLSRILGGFGTVRGATYPFKALITFIKNPCLIKYIAVAIALYGRI